MSKTLGSPPRRSMRPWMGDTVKPGGVSGAQPA